MSKPPFFVVPLTGTITADNEAAGYPASNVGRPEAPSLKWKTSGSTYVHLYCDFGSAKAIDFVALMNVTAQSGMAWRVKLGPSKAAVDGSTWTYDSGVLNFITPTYTSADGLYHSFLELPAVSTERWMRIEIGSYTGDIEAGALVIGKKVAPARFYDVDWEFSGEDRGSLDWTRTGVPDVNPGIKLRTVNFTLNWITEAEFEGIAGVRNMIETLGESGMVYLAFDPELSAYRQDRTYLGRLKKFGYARGKRKPGTYGGEYQILSPY